LPNPIGCFSFERRSSLAFSILPAAKMNVLAATENLFPGKHATWTFLTCFAISSVSIRLALA